MNILDFLKKWTLPSGLVIGATVYLLFSRIAHWRCCWPFVGEASPGTYFRDALHYVLQNTNGRPPTTCVALHTSGHSHSAFGPFGTSYLAYH